VRSLKATTEIPSQSRMANFGVGILGAGRSLQVVRADAYSDHPCDGNTHGSQAKREHWFTGGVGDVPADVSA
jgi:hypothetical protein